MPLNRKGVKYIIPQNFGPLAARLAEAYSRHTKRKHGQLQPKPAAREFSRADKEAQAWALIRLGNGCWLRGDLDDVLRHYQKAGKVFKGLGNKDGLQASLGGQANILKA